MSNLNDPRVLFALERTCLAWNRTSLALMAFGFVIERFEIFVRMLSRQQGLTPPHSGLAFWIGLAFILLGSLVAVGASVQYRTALHTLQAAEIPEGYGTGAGVLVNLAVAALGAALIYYLFQGHNQ